MTAHPEIREAAAIAVPDAKYGEVVGIWIVREPHTRISRDDVRSCVSKVMNPQVRTIPKSFAPCSRALESFLFDLFVSCPSLRPILNFHPPRMHQRGFGLLTRTAQMKSYQRQLVGRS